MTIPIDALADLVRASRRAAILTGAGVSTDSGIPDFRSRNGIWREFDPTRFATRDGLFADPVGFYDFWRGQLGFLESATPNVSHEVIAKLERSGPAREVITQNIDGLHQRAGSRNVLEAHGTLRTVRCVECGVREPSKRAFAMRGRAPRCRVCEGLLRPDVVLFGEPLGGAYEDALEAVARSDLVLVLGSSLTVAPISELVPYALERTIPVAIVNRDPTHLDRDVSLALRAELAPTMRALATALSLR